MLHFLSFFGNVVLEILSRRERRRRWNGKLLRQRTTDTPSLDHSFFFSSKNICWLLWPFFFFFFCYIRRARKKRVTEDSDEDSDGTGAGGGEDSDVEMADAYAHRKSDASESGKQTRASRLSARTRAKVCLCFICLCASGNSFDAGETLQWERWRSSIRWMMGRWLRDLNFYFFLCLWIIIFPFDDFTTGLNLPFSDK